MTQKKVNATLATASVLVVSLLLNQWLGSSVAFNGTKDPARGIASVSAKPEDYANKVKWEHQMADSIGTNNRAVASLATKPTLRDELLYGVLEGHYGFVYHGSQLASIEYSAEKAHGTPISIQDREKFLMKYKDLWAADFANVKLSSKEGQREIYHLISGAGEKTATAQLDFDPEGNLLSVKFSH